mmetsp:Transcript_15350/g.30813  ORF Transcript_15350/g.30813 Transcript_15350/m.30813 type:complete len:226 (-) Transcript_15350:370-1047(-)
MATTLEDRVAKLQLDSGMLGGDVMLTDRSTLSTTRSQYGRGDKRICPQLTLEQEEALMGMMYDNYMANDGKTLDYDRVVRSALTMQCDPKVAEALGAMPVKFDDAWVPDDAWMTDMCFAFTNADAELTARSRPVGAITPGGITNIVESASAELPELPPEMLAPIKGVDSSSSNSAPPGKKAGKKKGKVKDMSDAELLADPRMRAPSPKPSSRKKKKSPKVKSTPG